MSAPKPPELRFQSGGTLRQGTFYVQRAADQELPAALLAGELCYVLAPRQIGKSSLRVRAAQKLQSQGVRCISIDLNMAGTQETSPEAWYYSLVQEISMQLALPTDPLEFWQQHANTTATYRFSLLLRQAVLNQVKERVVLFIDEIDSVLALPFPTDDFFAAIRAVYNDRAENEPLQRLTFCLLGVAAPADLIQNPVLTPFNIGLGISLEDLTPAEAEGFLPGLHKARGNPQRMLQAILSWTSGHPYMTQRLCEALSNSKELGSEEGRVQRLVEQMFLSTGHSRDPNLAYAEKRLEKNRMLPSILRIYDRLLDGQAVEHERDDPVQIEMRLAGLAARRTVDGHHVLQIRNRIFASVFDRAWLAAQETQRRIDEPLRLWLGSGKQADFLLRGEALRQMLGWAAERRDLGEAELEFLLAGLEVEHQAELQLRKTAVEQRLVEEDRRKAAEAQRQAEEDQRKAIEARQWAEHEQLQALEDQRRAERGRQQAEFEKERITAQARARRQIILMLGGALGVLIVIVASLIWQTIEVRRASQVAIDKQREAERSQREAEKSKESALTAALDEKGQLAAYQATQPGRQAEALAAALEAVGPSLKSGQLPPSQTAEGLSMAAGVGVYSYRLPKHTEDWVRAATFSPDGSLLLTAGNDGKVYFWDGNTYCAKGVLNAHETHDGIDGQIRSVVFSHDGKRILTASNDKTAKVWDVASRELKFTLSGHELGLRFATFSPDDKLIITASDDGKGQVWDSQNGKNIKTLMGAPIDRYVVYAPNGKYFVTAGDGQYFTTAGDVAKYSPPDLDKAWLWSARSYKSTASLVGHAGPVRAIAFSPDGKLIATSSLDSTARIWDARTRQTTAVLSGHSEPVRAIAFSPDGRYVVTASDDKTARIWDIESGLPVLTLLGHKESVRSAMYSPDGTRIVTASIDRTVRIWYVNTGKALVTLSGHRQWLSSATYSPDGKHVLTASEDRTVRVWDAITGLEEKDRRISGHKSDVRSAVYSQDGKLIISTGNDRITRIWDAEARQPLSSSQFLQPLKSLFGHTDYVQFAVFSPDGTRIATASQDKTAIIWDAVSGAPLHTLSGHTKMLHVISFSPDGKRVATASGDRTVRIWDTEKDGEPLSVLSGPQDEVFAARYSPDGKRIVTACFDHNAYVWDANARTSDRPLMTLQGHLGGVWSAEYSPDGQYILTASNDQTARIWNAQDGTLVMTLAGHTGGLTYASFSPLSAADKLRVVTAGRDHVAVIHPAYLRDYFRIACNLWWVNREDITDQKRNQALEELCASEIGKWPVDQHLSAAGQCPK